MKFNQSSSTIISGNNLFFVYPILSCIKYFQHLFIQILSFFFTNCNPNLESRCSSEDPSNYTDNYFFTVKKTTTKLGNFDDRLVIK